MKYHCGVLVERYERGKQEYLERKKLLQCHFDHNKFHMDCPGIEPGIHNW
jgi:hypothetical protein